MTVCLMAAKPRIPRRLLIIYGMRCNAEPSAICWPKKKWMPVVSVPKDTPMGVRLCGISEWTPGLRRSLLTLELAGSTIIATVPYGCIIIHIRNRRNHLDNNCIFRRWHPKPMHLTLPQPVFGLMDPMIITVAMSGDVKLLKPSNPECPGTLQCRHAVITIPRNSEIIASYGWRNMCWAKIIFGRPVRSRL